MISIKHVSGGSFGFSTEPEMELRRAFYRNNDVRVMVKPHKSISTRLTISLGLLAMQAQAKRIVRDRGVAAVVRAHAYMLGDI